MLYFQTGITVAYAELKHVCRTNVCKQTGKETKEIKLVGFYQTSF